MILHPLKMHTAVENNVSEKLVLALFLKTCRSLRDPRNRRSRIDLVQASAKWELVFTAALEELERGETPKLPGFESGKEKAAA